MKAFRYVTGVAAPLPIADVDTDRLIPHRFVREPLSDAYSRYLLYADRFDAEGNEIADFVLNRPAYRNSVILVAGKNFGCGSSREAAVIALMAFGIRVVVSESFGDIFRANCLQNGLLPVTLGRLDVEDILRDLNQAPGTCMSVDLERQELHGPNKVVRRFDIEASRRKQLLEGLDDLAITLQDFQKINAFEQEYKAQHQWLVSAR